VTLCKATFDVAEQGVSLAKAKEAYVSLRTVLAWKGGVGGSQLVLINPADIHRNVPTRELLAKGWQIEPASVEACGLRAGDFVDLEAAGDRLDIRRVNGLRNATEARARPGFMADFVGEHRLQFPRVELPIDVTGDVGMRILRALAPLGLGSQLIIDGPASSGKTWTSQALARALLTGVLQGQVLTPKNSAFVFLAVGERPPDVGKLKGIIGRTFGEALGIDPVSEGDDPFPGVHRELYFGFTTDEAVLNAQIALERARRLVEMGKHVLFFIDSIWGLVLTLGGSLNGSGGGLAAAGVPREALKFVKDNFLFSGAVPGGGSLTLVITCLYEGPKSSSDTVLNEIGAPSATARWRHRLEMDTTMPRPWIDLSVTGTRELEFMFDAPRLALHREVQRRSLKDAGGPAERLAYLRHLLANTSFDALQAKWASEKAAPPSPEDRVSRSVEFLTGSATDTLGRITNPAKAAAAVLAMIRTGRSLANSAEAVEWLVKALSEAEREALFALLAKAELMPTVAETPAGDPLENFLDAADVLRNSGRDVRELARLALARMGLTLELLMDQPTDLGDPVERMKALLDLVAKETGRKFKKRERWAKELVERGFVTPENLEDEEALARYEIYQRLKGSGSRPGETMESLLASGPKKKS